MRGDPYQHIVLDVNGKRANGQWSYDEAEGVTIEAEWGPGPKQRCTIRIPDHSLLELHYATLRGAAKALDRRRAADRESDWLNRNRRPA